MNPAGHDLYLRLEATAEGGARVTLQREGDAPEPAADVADADPARLEARYLQPLRAFIETPVSPELLLELGRALAGLLLPDRVRARLITEAARVGAATPLRLRLTASDPWLAGLPWEFAYLEEIFPGDPGRFLGLHPRLILIRQPSAHRTIAPVEADPLRILVAWADPGSAAYPALPGLQAEVKSILAETRAPRLRGRVEVETLRSATPGALKRLLEEFSPHVLHFLGHGDAGPSGGFLVLEGDRPGAEKRLYADELARCLAGTPARLVVLSACRTGAPSAGIAQTLAEAGIGAVVGMQLPLRDAAARPFARAFYATLLETGAVEEAVQEGRQAIQGFGPDWGVPALTLAGPNGTLFQPSATVTRSPLPTGVVTFLFTDIEGSTILWEQHLEAMRKALPRHDALLRAAIEDHHGLYIKSTGDGLHAVFAKAPDAVAATLAAQQALQAETWPEQLPLRVRMVLHTGDADEREGDYYGPALNRATRLMAIGHGGQVLLSQVTRELVKESLPEGATLKELGSHRLKDLQEPEQVYQLLHPDLPSEFPPLKSLNTLPNNLPQQLSSFIGREREIAETTQSLAKTRLLTLTGTGGCGKTRLALQVAADALNDYEDGVWLVELAPLSDAALVPQAVASALGVAESPGQSLTETLTAFVKPKTLLLLLDNCEHLRDACAGLAHALLRACPNLRLLATSRKGLGLEGEMLYPVPPLALPDPKILPPLEELSRNEAVRLFCERAAFKRAGFALTEQNAEAVTQICRRVDGIPLAIELAAARLSALSVEQIAHFDDYFRILVDRQHARQPHQQALEATLDWSYDLLTPQEQALLRRLSVFAGGWTLEAAEAVCSGDNLDAVEILDLMASLVEASLVIAEDRDGARRYRMLETVRQYAADKLKDAGEVEAVRQRHLNYFLSLTEKAEIKMIGLEQATWLNILEAEHDNLRAALSCDYDGEKQMCLASTLWRFWHIRGYLSEGRAWLDNILSQVQDGSLTIRAKALIGAGVLAMLQGDYKAAHTFFKESLETRKRLEDTKGTAECLNNLGTLSRFLGDDLSTRSYYIESLKLYKEIGDKMGIALALNNLGMVARDTGENAYAVSLYEESLKIGQEIADDSTIATSLANLGVVYSDQGDYVLARSYYERSLNLRRASGHKWTIGILLYNLGEIAFKQGDITSARTFLTESLATMRDLGDKGTIAPLLVWMAAIAVAQSDHLLAAQLLGAEKELRLSTGAPLDPSLQKDYDRIVADVRLSLEEEEFNREKAKGSSLSLEQMIASILEKMAA